MRDVSQDVLNKLHDDERKINIRAEIYRKDDLANPVDISDDIDQVTVSYDEESANGNCDLIIDDTNGDYNPKNRDSTKNLVCGTFDPLLDPCNLIKIYCNFEDTETQGSYSVSKTKIWDVANLEDNKELSNTIITNDGLTLAYYLGSEICEVSNTDESQGTTYESCGAAGYDPWTQTTHRLIQNFKFTTANEKYPSRIRVKMKRPDPSTNSDPNAKIFCSLIESDEGFYLIDNMYTRDMSPEINKLWTTSKIATEMSDVFEYYDFECDYSGSLKPDKKYGLYFYSNLTNWESWDHFKVQMNDGVYTNYECWHYVMSPEYWAQWSGTSCDVLFEIYHREYEYESTGYAIFEYDCGVLVSSYDEVSYTSNDRGTVVFEYASSSDGLNWSSWYSNLSNVPVDRYLRIKVSLDSGGVPTDSPIISSIKLNYTISDSYEDIPVFTGVLGDEIDTRTLPGKVSLTCRDMSKFLQDIFVPLSESYDTTSSQIWYVEDIINSLLSNWLKDDSLIKIKRTISFEYKPTYFLIRHFQIRNNNLWDGIQLLADAMGEGIRFDELGILRYYPTKNQVTPDYIFDEDLIIKEDINVSDANIRNHIIVKVETPDGIVESVKENQDSIERFGKRYYEVNRSISSMLTSQDQAEKLAKMICEDLSVLPAECEIEVPYFPIIQLGDIIGIKSEKAGLDPNIEVFKVISYEHNLSSDSKRTSLVLKTHKKIIENYDKYPNPPVNLSGEILERTIQNYPNSGWDGKSKTFSYAKLSWDLPTQNTDSTTISHLRGTNIYRDGEFVAHIPVSIRGITQDVNWFIDYNAAPGSHTYKVKAINKYGKKSEFSNEITVNVPSPTTSS